MLRSHKVSMLLLAVAAIWCLTDAPFRPSTRLMPSSHSARDLVSQPQTLKVSSQQSLSFEANQGQTASQVTFMAHGNGYRVFLTATDATLALSKAALPTPEHTQTRAPFIDDRTAAQPGPPSVLRMTLVGANPQPRVTGQAELPGKVNYFIGNDPSKWRTSVPTYASVTYQAVYPGIDLIYHGNQRQLEYDFAIAPGADPTTITLAFAGADKLELTAQGELVLKTPTGEIYQRKPRVYQQQNGAEQPVAGRYILKGSQQVGFAVDAYDTNRPLVIDPVLSYSTYLGGNDYDLGNAIAADTDGNIYVTGLTRSTNFPIGNPIPGQESNPLGHYVGFVTKVSATGSLIYSTYLSCAQGYGIVADDDGHAHVAGGVGAPSCFPTKYSIMSYGGGYDSAFVMQLDAVGALVYSTYLGGSGPYVDDIAYDIAADAAGDVYVTGITNSTNFLTTPGVVQPKNPGGYSAFASKLTFDPTTSILSLAYSTYLGEVDSDQGNGIAVDGDGNVYLTGGTGNNYEVANTFIKKLNASGSALIYATYPGVAGYDNGTDIAVDAERNAYVVGVQGLNVSSAFVLKVDPVGSTIYRRLFYGNGSVDGRGIAIDTDSNVYVTGSTGATDFPTIDPARYRDAFVIKLDRTGAISFSTALGGTALDVARNIAVRSCSGNMYVTGRTESSSFPLVNPTWPGFSAEGGDAYIAQFSGDDRPTIDPPPPFLASGNDWHMQVQVSQNDGVVLRDVMLGTRYMAKEISLPYYHLTTTKNGAVVFDQRLELKPNSDDPFGRSRLVGLRVTPESSQPFVIEATYQVDRLAESQSRLCVTQRYEFFPRQEAGCEPSNSLRFPLNTITAPPLPCARYKPIVTYSFDGQQGEVLKALNVAQRLYYQVDGHSPNVPAIFRDCDTVLPVRGLICARQNPLGRELLAAAVVNGQAGDWDNIHQTYYDHVDEPNPNDSTHPSEFIGYPKPGCPECAHVHWRWSASSAIVNPAFGRGKPLIPPGSKQSVDVAVVRWNPNEADPNPNMSSLVNGEALTGGDIVFWYSATSHRGTDAFLTHGGFYSPYTTFPGIGAPFVGGGGGSGGAGASGTFSFVSEPGITTIDPIDPPSAAGTLPKGFTVFENNAFDIGTTATVTGSMTISLTASTVDDPKVFARLRVFHNESGVLVDRTILAPSTQAPNFDTRTISARVDALGPIVVALIDDSPISRAYLPIVSKQVR